MDSYALADSLDPDQTALEQSDQGLHCLPFTRFFDTSFVRKNEILLNLRIYMLVGDCVLILWIIRVSLANLKEQQAACKICLLINNLLDIKIVVVFYSYLSVWRSGDLKTDLKHNRFVNFL